MVFQMLVTISVVLFALYLILSYAKHKLNLENKPPGDFPLPIIGNLHQFTGGLVGRNGKKEAPYILLKHFHEKHGPVVGSYFGQTYFVAVSDYEIMKDLMNSDVWSARPWDSTLFFRSWGRPYGLFFSSGEEWKEMRRFTIRTLREFGFGNAQGQEVVMMEELTEMLSSLNKKLESQENVVVVNMKNFFTTPTLNIIWSMLFGTRFSHDDVKLRDLSYLARSLTKTAAAGGNLVKAFPILAVFVARKLAVMTEKVNNFISECLKERREEGVYKHGQHDLVDVFLKEIDSRQGQGELNYYSDRQLITIIKDLFYAGTDTTSNLLEFGILYMVVNPHVQEKVQEEIDRVVGSSRFPTAADRANMPYTAATLLELERHVSVVPILPRVALEDTSICGYTIKKGTRAMFNVHGVHFSKKIWTKPEEFDPTRFLNSSENNGIINADKVMAFGGGKRICIGETMARLTLFTFFTSLLQKYSFFPLPNEPLPSIEPEIGFTLTPKEYSVLIELRQSL